MTKCERGIAFDRGSSRIGLSLEDIVEDTSFDAEIEVDNDPFEAMRDDY